MRSNARSTRCAATNVNLGVSASVEAGKALNNDMPDDAQMPLDGMEMQKQTVKKTKTVQLS